MAIQTRRRVARPLAHGAYHWRLVGEAFRNASRPPLVAGVLAALATAAHLAAPTSAGAATAAVALGVVLFFSIAYALGVPQDVAFEHRVELLLERRMTGNLRHETTLLLMSRVEDVDRRAITLFGGPILGAAIESAPPCEAAFDGLDEAAGTHGRLSTLADSFEMDPDAELAGALREMASAMAAAGIEGVRCRLVAVPPYPSAQALDLMGSPRRYA